MAKSYKHKDKRAYIPSKEEEGYEQANQKVQEKEVAYYPKNPVVHRGQDPELMWMNKYGPGDRDDTLKVDIRSLYRHEHIMPEALIKRLYNIKKDENAAAQLDLFSTFGNEYEIDELEKVGEYYKHQNDWKNRMILGDSLLVMNSLLEREGMAGKVQTIYIDPPYGIKYGGNWQVKLNDRSVKDGKDEHLTEEPEMIKAYRDTWELGIHSYLSYLRERLIVAKELLTESGSCFVQISDDNLHLVRCLMDEVFGSENFVSNICFTKTTGLQASNRVSSRLDYIIWYSKSSGKQKYRPLFDKIGDPLETGFDYISLPNGEKRRLKKIEKENLDLIPEGSSFFMSDNLTKPGPGSKYEINYQDQIFTSKNRWWGTPKESMLNLIKRGRVFISGKTLRYCRFYNDFPYKSLSNLWDGIGGASNPKYVVQTSNEVLKRCILMTTDPGDLILDPTCGSGTTAYVAEQWGRRWITTDTSRIALNIAKNRLMTGVFPFYELYDQVNEDIRQGFIYKKVPHITLKALANDEPFEEETLYDQPKVDNKKIRVAGPFTVETLQSLNPTTPEEIDDSLNQDENFEAKVFEHLKTAGIKTGRKDERATFVRIDPLNSEYLHAEGFYKVADDTERKAYLHIGPKFGTVSKRFVNQAVRECRARGDADWLVVLGFSFESDIKGDVKRASMGSFEVSIVRMHDDLLQEGLKKKPAKSAASFVTIGEPDIVLNKVDGNQIHVEIKGLDIYDPIKDQVKARNLHDIAYWMVDDNYDGSNFIVTQVFFCGGNKKEFTKWRKGIDDMAKRSAKKKLENTLKIELDEEAFDRLYGFKSHPFPNKKGRRVAVRVISQFGEESMKVLEVE
ncbi:MAG: site-specific DNA-methyltransferase [Leptospiraceae bacterium]|nr:site-specific DNA-methyltransferase [Leptospiraceae bacterium]